MAKNEVKWGAILSYILIIVNTLYGFVLAPFILSTIGNSEYGVYKTIGAMTASLAVLDLGIGGTVQRYVAKYNALKDEKGASNYSAMALLQVVLLSFVTIIVCVVMYFVLDSMYSESFTANELLRAKQIYIVQAASIVLHIWGNAIAGIVAGYNKFVFSNTLKISSIFIRVILYFIILPIYKNSLVIVCISLFVEMLIITIEFLYIKLKIKHKIKLYKWDNFVFKESFGYTILLFIQSIIIQFNGNIDNIVIGAVLGTSAVTIYSFAIQIFNMYEQCSTAVSGVILPTVTNKIYSGATDEEMEKMVVKFGRVQWLVLGAALVGFITCGREFFSLWIGEGFDDAWYLALILMIPVTFPLVVNVCLAILKVKNLLKFRTIELVYSTLINAIVTIIGVRYFGYWAAAIGTALSTIIGSVISLNIYYHKKLNIRVFKLYLDIAKGSIFCMMLAGMTCIILNKFIYGSWISFTIKVLSFILIYIVTLMIFGLNKEEKNSILLKFRRK